MQRTETDEPLGKDFTTWDLPRIYREIDLHFSNALADGRLKSIETSEFGDLLTKPTLPENYRPTLYDFIAHEALGFYISGEFAAAKPEDAKLLYDEFVTEFKKVSDKVSEGKFGAFMEIMIKNSGPVTFNFSI